jgi:hypothetical protein
VLHLAAGAGQRAAGPGVSSSTTARYHASPPPPPAAHPCSASPPPPSPPPPHPSPAPARTACSAAPPVIILSDDLVSAPEPTLRALCAALDLPFDPGMLAWPPGPRPEDGCWAPWWYRATHASSGFGGGTGPQEGAAAGAKAPLPAHLRALLEDCRPLYEALRRRALRPAPQPPSPPPPSPSPAPAPSPGGGTHAYAPDPRNADVLIGIRDGVSGRYDLVWRPEARLSVLDAGFVLGDGVWEGLRVHRGVLLFAGAHLRRLFEGATALDLDLGLTPGEVRALVYRCLDANGMAGASGVHVRLMATRGLKATPYQHPAATVGGATVVVIPEHKEADPAVKVRGEGRQGRTRVSACLQEARLGCGCGCFTECAVCWCAGVLRRRAGFGLRWSRGSRYLTGVARERRRCDESVLRPNDEPPRLTTIDSPPAVRPRLAGPRHPAVHGARPARRPRRPGPGAQLPLQAQLHSRLHPGGGPGGGRARHLARCIAAPLAQPRAAPPPAAASSCMPLRALRRAQPSAARCPNFVSDTFSGRPPRRAPTRR